MESRRPIPSSLPAQRQKPHQALCPKPHREHRVSAERRWASPESHTALAKFHSHSPRRGTETVPSHSAFPRPPASCRTAQAAAPPNKAREQPQARAREQPQAYSARRRQLRPTPPTHLQRLPSRSVSASRSLPLQFRRFTLPKRLRKDRLNKIRLAHLL
jgi:hypothetical protein